MKILMKTQTVVALTLTLMTTMIMILIQILIKKTAMMQMMINQKPNLQDHSLNREADTF